MYVNVGILASKAMEENCATHTTVGISMINKAVIILIKIVIVVGGHNLVIYRIQGILFLTMNLSYEKVVNDHMTEIILSHS